MIRGMKPRKALQMQGFFGVSACDRKTEDDDNEKVIIQKGRKAEKLSFPFLSAGMGVI